MVGIERRVAEIDWERVETQFEQQGFASVEQVINEDMCEKLVSMYDIAPEFRKTVEMARHGFGKGSYRYWHYPLPEAVQLLRECLYPHLARIANRWMRELGTELSYPGNLKNMLALCHQHQQLQPTPLLLKYQQGGYNTLHQDIYGEVFFPLQAAVFLSQKNEDYCGGEFVLTQQTPRAQSKATVISPNRGDLILFPTRYRSIKGSRKYYKGTIKHGVSEVTSGNRYTLGIIFHDAQN